MENLKNTPTIDQNTPSSLDVEMKDVANGNETPDIEIKEEKESKDNKEKRGRKKKEIVEENGNVFDSEKCSNVLDLLFASPCSELFRLPIRKRDIPVYFEVIKNPIDLQTIRRRLDQKKFVLFYFIYFFCELFFLISFSFFFFFFFPSSRYSNLQSFESDIRLLVGNARRFNGFFIFFFF